METTGIANPLDIIKSSAELITPQVETRAGFVSLALERSVQATPMVEQARSLFAIAKSCKSAIDLLRIDSIQKSLLTAAGVSEKSAAHWIPDAKIDAVREFVAKFLEPAGENFPEELVYRYLLTRGDALGGAMRNIGGELGERKFTRALISTLSVKDIKCRRLVRKSRTWLECDPDEPGIEQYVKGITWQIGNKPLTIMYNVKLPISRVNVDLCLMACGAESWQENLGQPSQFLALGELKSGVDPAGSFEHWATSRTALSRTRAELARLDARPQMFFVGASITQTVADEVWTFIQNGTLSSAANLTNGQQLHLLCDWLTSF